MFKYKDKIKLFYLYLIADMNNPVTIFTSLQILHKNEMIP